VFWSFRQFKDVQYLINKIQEALLILLYLNPDNFSSIIKPVYILLVNIVRVEV
jgi:hypothetical protein